MKREREEEVVGGAAMSPATGAGASSAARVLRAMEAPSGFHCLRAPSPFVRAMRTRIDPPPSPLAAAPTPRLPPLPPPLPQVPERRRQGRPRNCERLLPPPGFHLTPPSRAPPALTLAAHGHGQLGGLQPHVLKIDVGEDIISKILGVSKVIGKSICVLSVLGIVQEANLLHSAVIINHKGPLEIIRMFGSILTSDNPGFGCLSVTFACADCSVVGGIVAGPLVAATPAQAIVGCFHNDVFQANKTPNINAHYPNSQVPTGYWATHYPNSQVAIGTGSVHCLNSEVAISSWTWSKDDPNSQVPIADGSSNHSNSQVTVGDGSTYHPNSQITIGTGSTQYPSYRVPIGNGGTHEPSSDVTVGGSTSKANSEATVGDGSSRHQPGSHVTIVNSQATVGDGSTREPNYHVSAGDGSTDNANSHAIVGDGNTNNTDAEVVVGDGGTSKGSSQGTLVDGNSNCPNGTVCAGDERCQYPNSKVTVGDGGTPCTEGSSPEYASCTAVEQGGSSEIDVKPSQWWLNLATV
ncbi:unnamed protein product [Urochloa humidicola]